MAWWKQLPFFDHESGNTKNITDKHRLEFNFRPSLLSSKFFWLFFTSLSQCSSCMFADYIYPAKIRRSKAATPRTSPCTSTIKHNSDFHTDLCSFDIKTPSVVKTYWHYAVVMFSSVKLDTVFYSNAVNVYDTTLTKKVEKRTAINKTIFFKFYLLSTLFTHLTSYCWNFENPILKKKKHHKVYDLHQILLI